MNGKSRLARLQDIETEFRNLACHYEMWREDLLKDDAERDDVARELDKTVEVLTTAYRRLEADLPASSYIPF